MPSPTTVGGNVALLIPNLAVGAATFVTNFTMDSSFPADNYESPCLTKLAKSSTVRTSTQFSRYAVTFAADTRVNSVVLFGLDTGTDDLDDVQWRSEYKNGADGTLLNAYVDAVDTTTGTDYQDVLNWDIGPSLAEMQVLQKRGRLQKAFWDRDVLDTTYSRPYTLCQEAAVYIDKSVTVAATRVDALGCMMVGAAWHPQMSPRAGAQMRFLNYGGLPYRQAEFIVDRVHEAEALQQVGLDPWIAGGARYRGFFSMFPEQTHLQYTHSFPCVIEIGSTTLRHKVALNDTTSKGSTLKVVCTECWSVDPTFSR